MTAPKYYAGILTWWPAEHALRVVGIECARRLFKDEFDKELSRFDREQRASSDFDFLIVALPFVETMQAVIREMVPTALALDQLRGRVLKGLSKRAAKLLFKHYRAHGSLTLFEEQRVQTETGGVLTKVAVKRFPLDGALLLAEWRFNPSALLDTAGRVIDGLKASNEDDILNAVERLGPEGMTKARQAVLEAARSIKEAHRLCRSIQQFLAPPNLSRLMEWSFDHRAELQLDIRRDQFDATVFSHKPHRVVVPVKAKELTAFLPDVSFLDGLGRYNP